LKVWFVALVLALFVGGAGAVPARADVVGSFGLTLSLDPIPCTDVALFPGVPLSDSPCESTVILFDLQTELEIITAFDELFAEIHSHAGVTGFEDLLLILVASLGDLKLREHRGDCPFLRSEGGGA